MKKMVMMSLFFILLMNGTSTNAIAQKEDQMADLASLVANNNLTVDSWNVTIKEQMPKDRLLEFVEKWKDSHFVTTEKGDSAIKYIIGDSRKNRHITESFKVIIPNNKEYQAEMIAVLEGTKWTKAIEKDYQSRLQSIMEQYFTVNAKKFACLTTEIDGMIDSAYVLNKMEQQLQMKYVSTQEDNVENSVRKKMVSGYTPLWEEQITIMDKPVNVHMAVTQPENENAKLTIGTPILITEY